MALDEEDDQLASTLLPMRSQVPKETRRPASKGEIQDRSKVDVFWKAFALLQTSRFIL